MRILGIGIRYLLVLGQRRFDLVIAQQAVGQTALSIQIVLVLINRMVVSVNRALVVFLLLEGVAQDCVYLACALCVGHRLKHVSSFFVVAFLVVQIGEINHRLFGIRLQLARRLEFSFGLQIVLIEDVKTAKK